MSIKTNFISEHILHVSNGASAIWRIKHICHILFNASQQCPYWQKAIFNRPCTPAGLTLQLLPRENGLFCIKLLSAVHKNLIFSPTKHTASQVNCYVASDTFISLEFRANPIINNLHTGHITAVRHTVSDKHCDQILAGPHTHTDKHNLWSSVLAKTETQSCLQMEHRVLCMHKYDASQHLLLTDESRAN